MSRIIFQKEYMILFPSFVRAQVHKHPFMHLFVGSKTCQVVVNDEKVQGNRILLDSNVKHMVEPDHHCDFFLLIDHTSHVARQLRDNYLQPAPYCHMEGQMVEMPENMVELPEEEVIAGVEKLLASMGVTEQPSEGRDERVRQVIEKLTSGEWLACSVKELAQAGACLPLRKCGRKDYAGCPGGGIFRVSASCLQLQKIYRGVHQ